ncbi:MAG: toxin-antitoxin system HicB family antitoxin [Egibacteraceae bacterium]
MKQLIARIDEDLHRRLKDRAAAERRTLNALVTEALEAAVAPRSERERLRERARLAGLLDEPATPERFPSMAEVLACTRGAGAVFTESLEEVRGPR